MSKLTLDEAIKHCLEVVKKNEQAKKSGDLWIDTEYEDCCAYHRQLAEWLTELQELRMQIEAPKLGSIEEYHYELAKCKAAFWSCNRSCMNAEEQYRRKADELRKAQEQIAEYKRLLKAAVEDLAKIPCNNDVYIPSSCNACIKQGNCDYSDSFKWRHADEALKLIGGSENENNK